MRRGCGDVFKGLRPCEAGRCRSAACGKMAFGNLAGSSAAGRYWARSMPCPIQFPAFKRADRASFPARTPVVLRLQDGARVSGRLEVVSATGGLVSLPRPLAQGAIAKLIFLTSAGPVLAVAEMLPPLSWELQPFRFLALYKDDRRRLDAAIHSSIEQARHDHKQLRRDRAQIENFRAW